MKILGTYFADEGELESSLKRIENGIKENPDCMMLIDDTTNECIARAVEVWIDDDHIVVEFEADENYEELFVREGFSISQ